MRLWLDEFRSHNGGNVPIIIADNKSESSERQVTSVEAEQRKGWPNVDRGISKTGHNVKSMFRRQAIRGTF
ncbi:hypothetical protein Q1695_011205 [Nippostrongylus brasiliensis]|nr:hypothetical protein Q1695_011205 [Nippostrongylus brasiliensis]